MNGSFTSMVLKTNHNLINGYQDTKVVHSKQEQTVKRTGHRNKFLGCSRSFACWHSGRPKDSNSCLLVKCFEKVNQRFGRKTPEKESLENLSTVAMLLLVPLTKQEQSCKNFNGKLLNILSYSSDLALSDLFLFPNLKKYL